MNSVEHHGGRLASYSGTGNVRFTDNGVLMESTGHFEVSQFSSGQVTVNFVPMEPISPTRPEDGGGLYDGIRFSGKSLDGWSIETVDEVLYARTPWLFAPMIRHPYELSFHPLRLSARRDTASDGQYSRVRFLISNFLWHGKYENLPESLVVNAPHFSAVVEPVDNYLTVARRLVGFQGAEPTAYVSVESVSGIPVHIDEFTEFVDSLVYLFRLVTGNQVNWYFADATSVSTSEVRERVFHYAQTAPYSNTVVFSPLRAGYVSGVPKVDFHSLCEAFFGTGDTFVDRHILRNLIDYFTNSCDDRAYLEVRGLMASSLTELLAAKYTDAKGYSEVVPEDEFLTSMFPAIKSAIRDVPIPKDLRSRVVSHLRGAYRRSFRSRLRRLVRDFGLPLREQDLERIVEVRNLLVHSGAYPQESNHRDWLGDYRLVAWTNFCLLCRMIGYEGELPWHREGRRLEI